jgi:tripartite-type tricarboxylate transporter receptor subunit TctC
MRRTRARAGFAALVLATMSCLVVAMLASAQLRAAEPAWPSRALRIVVAQAPGGPPDLIARFIAEPLGRALGMAVVVENRPGASGIIGVNAVAQAAPDGYTLLIGTLSTHALVPNANPGATFDPVRDFVPIANLFRSIKVLWVNPALPVRSAGEWIAYAKQRPGALNYASGGVGSSNHIDMELLNATAGIDVLHVPYNGPSAAIAAVASGDAHAMIVSIGTGLPLAQGGRVRPLVLFGERRSLLLPDVPLAAEQGLASIDLSAWIGLLAPAGTPDPVVTRLNAEVVRILRTPAAADWASRQGLEIIGDSSAAFAATLAADYRRWGEVIRRMKPRSQ